MNRLARARTTTTTLLVLALAGLLDLTTARAQARANGRDRGDVLQYVIIAAGVTALAVAVIAWVRPVVMRYLTQIQ